MYSYKTIIVSIFFLNSLISTRSEILNHRAIIDYVNQNGSTWTARQNFPDDVTTEELKRRNGALGIHPDPNFKLEVRTHRITKTKIPESFDARKEWSKCSGVIGNIRDQGGCGSCWSFAASEVMADRLCIATKGAEKFQFSPQDFLECCNKCVPKGAAKCNGGYLYYAFDYLKSGVVSGGDYGSTNGCKPYSQSAYVSGIVPNKCNQQCQTKYKVSYQNDKKTGKSVYTVTSKNVQQIQAEIMNNGPVAAMYEVYADFYNYKNGVYQHTTGLSQGYHAVKIIGWGTENGTPYWLVANSWGKAWGDLGGFFKILRGKNHCKIEETIVTGASSSSWNYGPLNILFVFTIVLSYFKV